MGAGHSAALARIRRSTLITDTVVAVALTGVSLLAVSVAIDTAPPGYRPPSALLVVVLTVALVLPLALRRRFPLSVLVVVTIVFFPYRIAEIPDLTASVVVYWLALYSAGVYGDLRWRDPVRALNVVASVGYLSYRLVAAGGTLATGSLLLRALFLILFNVFFVVAAWVFGNTMATRRRYEAELIQRAAQLERERDLNARRAVFHERVRIARELHDVVAHHVSIMGIQAGAARRVMQRDPAGAADALTLIEDASRRSVHELHQLLGFLRQPGDPDDLAGKPSLADLPALVDAVASTSLDVQLVVSGDPRPIPAGVGLSSYRLVQEALTNTVKHAGAEHARVTVRYRSDRVELEVVDDGAGREESGGVDGAGHGLLGMRERVALHGGTIQAGPLTGVGYQVSACLPVTSVAR